MSWLSQHLADLREASEYFASRGRPLMAEHYRDQAAYVAGCLITAAVLGAAPSQVAP